jgi:hypothetical protein
MRPLFAVIAGCAAALFVPLLIPLATGRVFTLDDLGAYHIPMRHLYSEALRHGDSILWTPAVYRGFYLFGESQLGMAHPWHLLLYRFFPLTVAFNLEMISSYVAMFAGMVALLRRAGLSKESCWFGAMTFTFSGYNLFHLVHPNLIATVAHIPWLILAAHIVATAADRHTRAKASIALALILASQILAGHLQFVWLGVLAVGGLCIYLLWSNISSRGMPFIAGAFVVGGLVGGVQLLPLLDAVRTSERTGWSIASSLAFSLAPVDMVQLWMPIAFRDRPSIEWLGVHEFIVYNGAFCTAAIAWVVVRRRALERYRLSLALLLFAAIALLLAFGKYSGLYTSLLALPGFSWFRAPSRHLALYDLSISIVAAIVFEDLAALAHRREHIAWQRLWPLAFPGVLSIATAAVTSRLIVWRGFHLSTFSEAIPWVLLTLVVLSLFVATARGARWALPVLIVIAAADQGFFGFRYVFSDPNQPMQSVEALAARAPTPPDARQGDLLQPYAGFGLANVPILRGFNVWTGYVGLTPALALTPNRDLVDQRIAGAKWRLTDFPVVEPIPDPAARARLLSAVKVSSDLAVDVRHIDVLNEALITEALPELTGPPGVVRIVEDRPGLISVETTAPGRQLLALTERFHAGWQVTDRLIRSDGAAGVGMSARPIVIYGDFLGYVVDAGAHRVTFRFRPTSFYRGLIVTAAGLLLVLGMVPFAFFGTRSQVRKPDTTSGSLMRQPLSTDT